MAVNPHFEGTVRLQRELGHRVIAVGPYAVIRHPGYLGLIAWGVSGPLLLCSVAALVPAALVVGWIVLRTALEDAFLRRELAGYAEYTAQVRWRLVPGLW
jgi:protein-S-isoprenylcysteine O-methyltransferase Ste14